MTPLFLDFLEILTLKGLQIYLYFRRVFKKVDFTKTSVSPRRERQFQGPQPSKNNQKSMKNNTKKTTSQQTRHNRNFHQFGPPKTSQNRPQISENREFSLSQMMPKKQKKLPPGLNAAHPAKQAQRAPLRSSIYL